MKTKKQELIFDKITFTLPIEEDEREALLVRVNEPDFYQNYKRKVYRKTGGRYKNNYQFEIHDGNTIELSLYPINKSHNFLRVEYNPAKLGKDGRKALRKFLLKFLTVNLVKTIYFHAKVTRLDLTLDVYNMKPNLYIHKNRVKQSELHRDDDVITSQIIGSDKSNCRITLYDKNIEQGNTDSGTTYHRIEIRLRALDCSMHQLDANLLNEFAELNFFKASFLKEKRLSKKFRNRAYKHGLNSALNELDDNDRRCYRRYLEDHQVYPISLDDSDFEEAHKVALGSLVHTKYKENFL